MPEEGPQQKKVSRRNILSSTGATGIGITAFNFGAVSSGSAANGDEHEVQPQSSVPGVSYETTLSIDDICYYTTGVCLLIASPKAPLAAKGCVAQEAGCFAAETIERLPGCSSMDVRVYTISSWIPARQEMILVPKCISDTYAAIEDVLREVLGYVPSPPTPWDTQEYEAETRIPIESEKTGVEMDEGEWAVSEEFLDEYDLHEEFEGVKTF